MSVNIRLLVTSLLICVLFACSGKKDFPVAVDEISPDSIIPAAKMVLVLADVHVVEAAALNARNEGNEKILLKDYYQGIFTKFHITSGMYDQSLHYYRQNPEQYAKIYEEVITVLENRQKPFARKTDQGRE